MPASTPPTKTLALTDEELHVLEAALVALHPPTSAFRTWPLYRSDLPDTLLHRIRKLRSGTS